MGVRTSNTGPSLITVQCELGKKLTSIYLSIFSSGSSSGIGEGTAIYFAKNGAKVSLTGRNEKNLKQVALKCQQVSPNKEKVEKLR